MKLQFSILEEYLYLYIYIYMHTIQCVHMTQVLKDKDVLLLRLTEATCDLEDLSQTPTSEINSLEQNQT